MSDPFVYVSQSQAPGVYELTFVMEQTQTSYYLGLRAMELLADAIRAAVAEQRERDSERHAL